MAEERLETKSQPVPMVTVADATIIDPEVLRDLRQKFKAIVTTGYAPSSAEDLDKCFAEAKAKGEQYVTALLATDFGGCNALEYSCGAGIAENDKVIWALLEAGMSPLEKKPRANTNPLLAAVRANRFDVVQLILEFLGNALARKIVLTFLPRDPARIVAGYLGEDRLFHIQNDLDEATKEALTRDFVRIAALLCKCGANISAKDFYAIRKSLDPEQNVFMAAIHLGFLKIVAEMFRYDFPFKQDKEPEAVRLLYEAKDKDGNNVLMYLAMSFDTAPEDFNRFFTVLETLPKTEDEKKENPKAVYLCQRNSEHHNALMSAVKAKCRENAAELVLHQCPEGEVLIPHVTPIFADFFALQNFEWVIRLLDYFSNHPRLQNLTKPERLKNFLGGDLQAKDPHKNSLLHVAAMGQKTFYQIDWVEVFFNLGLDVTATNKPGFTPLMCAAGNPDLYCSDADHVRRAQKQTLFLTKAHLKQKMQSEQLDPDALAGILLEVFTLRAVDVAAGLLYVWRRENPSILSSLGISPVFAPKPKESKDSSGAREKKGEHFARYLNMQYARGETVLTKALAFADAAFVLELIWLGADVSLFPAGFVLLKLLDLPLPPDKLKEFFTVLFEKIPPQLVDDVERHNPVLQELISRGLPELYEFAVKALRKKIAVGPKFQMLDIFSMSSPAHTFLHTLAEMDPELFKSVLTEWPHAKKGLKIQSKTGETPVHIFVGVHPSYCKWILEFLEKNLPREMCAILRIPDAEERDVVMRILETDHHDDADLQRIIRSGYLTLSNPTPLETALRCSAMKAFKKLRDAGASCEPSPRPLLCLVIEKVNNLPSPYRPFKHGKLVRHCDDKVAEANLRVARLNFEMMLSLIGTLPVSALDDANNTLMQMICGLISFQGFGFQIRNRFPDDNFQFLSEFVFTPVMALLDRGVKLNEAVILQLYECHFRRYLLDQHRKGDANYFRYFIYLLDQLFVATNYNFDSVKKGLLNSRFDSCGYKSLVAHPGAGNKHCSLFLFAIDQGKTDFVWNLLANKYFSGILDQQFIDECEKYLFRRRLTRGPVFSEIGRITTKCKEIQKQLPATLPKLKEWHQQEEKVREVAEGKIAARDVVLSHQGEEKKSEVKRDGKVTVQSDSAGPSFSASIGPATATATAAAAAPVAAPPAAEPARVVIQSIAPGQKT